MQLVHSLYCEPKEDVIMGSFLTKTQLPALLSTSRIVASSVKKTVKNKARKDSNNGVDIRKFRFQPLTIITKRSLLDIAAALDPPLYIVTVFNHKAKQINF